MTSGNASNKGIIPSASSRNLMELLQAPRQPDQLHAGTSRPLSSRRVRLQLSGEMLAQTLGASRQTISTLLTDLTRSGILLKEQRGVYCIIDESRLRELLD